MVAHTGFLVFASALLPAEDERPRPHVSRKLSPRRTPYAEATQHHLPDARPTAPRLPGLLRRGFRRDAQHRPAGGGGRPLYETCYSEHPALRAGARLADDRAARLQDRRARQRAVPAPRLPRDGAGDVARTAQRARLLHRRHRQDALLSVGCPDGLPVPVHHRGQALDSHPRRLLPAPARSRLSQVPRQRARGLLRAQGRGDQPPAVGAHHRPLCGPGGCAALSTTTARTAPSR